MSLEEAQTLVMTARVQLGWVDPAELGIEDDGTAEEEEAEADGRPIRQAARRMTRGGRVKDRDEPERRCIVTGDVQPKAGLIRFVVGPDGEIVPDLAGRAARAAASGSAPTATRSRQAAAKGLFARAAKRPVTVPPDLVDRVEALLARRVVDLSRWRARRAARWRASRRSRAALAEGQREGAVAGGGRIGARQGQALAAGGRKRLVRAFPRHELGLAFGRDRVIHAARLRRLADGQTRPAVVVRKRRRACGRCGEGWRGKAPPGKARDGMRDTRTAQGQDARAGRRHRDQPRAAELQPRPDQVRSRSSTSASASSCPSPARPRARPVRCRPGGAIRRAVPPAFRTPRSSAG